MSVAQKLLLALALAGGAVCIATGSPSRLTLSPGVSRIVIRRNNVAKQPAENDKSKGKDTKGQARPASVDPAKLEQAEEKRRQVEALLAKLATAEEQELARIEEELVGLGQAALVPLKLAELSDNFELRRRAIQISARLRWRLVCSPGLLKAHPELLQLMSGHDTKARAALVDKICKSAKVSALGFLGECLADPQTYVRQRAIDGLLRVAKHSRGGKSSRAHKQVAALLDTALGDDDRNIRLLAVGALAKIKAVKPTRLAQMLDDDSLEVRTTVIRAMGFSGNRKATKYIKALLDDPQWRIRAAALEALDQLVDEKRAYSVAPLVMKRLNDQDEYVRELAVKILGQWNYRKAAPQLLQLIKEKKIGEEGQESCDADGSRFAETTDAVYTAIVNFDRRGFADFALSDHSGAAAKAGDSSGDAATDTCGRRRRGEPFGSDGSSSKGFRPLVREHGGRGGDRWCAGYDSLTSSRFFGESSVASSSSKGGDDLSHSSDSGGGGDRQRNYGLCDSAVRDHFQWDED